jgi:hypothetical protein
MAALTLNHVLMQVEALPADEQEMLENLLHQPQIETTLRRMAEISITLG